MKDTIRNADDFANRFKQIRPDDFSRAALEVLFDFYEELEEDTGEETEFDPVAICCDWAEMDEDEARREYGAVVDFSECEELSDVAEELIEATTVLKTRNDTLVVLAF